MALTMSMTMSMCGTRYLRRLRFVSGSRPLPADGARLTSVWTAGFLLPPDRCRAAGPATDTGGLTVPHTGVLYGLRATPGDHLLDLLDPFDQRGEIPGRVHIAIHLQPARLAPEGPLGQGHLGFHRPTPRAGLRQPKEGVGLHQPPAGPSALVAKQATDLAHTRVSDRPGEPPISDHPGH